MTLSLVLINLIADYDGALDRLRAHFDYFGGLRITDTVAVEVLFQDEAPDEAAYLLAERHADVDGDDGLAEVLRALGVEVVEEGEPSAPTQTLSPCQLALLGLR